MGYRPFLVLLLAVVKPCQDGCIHGTCNTTASRRGMCQCASGWTGPACNQGLFSLEAHLGFARVMWNLGKRKVWLQLWGTSWVMRKAFAAYLCPAVRAFNSSFLSCGVHCVLCARLFLSLCLAAVCQRPCKHGTCVKPNVCLCNKGWKGSSCRKGVYWLNLSAIVLPQCNFFLCEPRICTPMTIHFYHCLFREDPLYIKVPVCPNKKLLLKVSLVCSVLRSCPQQYARMVVLTASV